MGDVVPIRPIVDIEIPYTPRRGQQEEAHAQLAAQRFGVQVAHRRFGKSTELWNEAQKRALETNRSDFRGGYIGPTYAQVKAIIWDIAKHYAAPVPGIKINESELRIDYPNGARLRLFGADKPDSLRGLYFDLVICDEFDLMKMAMWTEILRPAISDRLGCAYFAGTFKFTNGPLGQLYDRALADPEWFALLYKASETNYVDPHELERAKRDMSEEEYAREYECERSAAVRGAYYAKQISQIESEGRIRRVPFDPALPVVTMWDIGVSDSTAVWFAQVAGTEVRFLKYEEGTSEGLPYWVRLALDWGTEKGAHFREHLFPHDMEARDFSGDGRTRCQVAEALGLVPIRIIRRRMRKERSEVHDRIDAVRRLLPRCIFDAEGCKAGLDALRSYRPDENVRTGELKDMPLHDWASHGADAIGCGAVGLEDQAAVTRPAQPVRRRT